MYTAVVPSFSPFFASRVTSSAKTSRAASIGPICALQQQDSQIEVPSTEVRVQFCHTVICKACCGVSDSACNTRPSGHLAQMLGTSW